MRFRRAGKSATDTPEREKQTTGTRLLEEALGNLENRETRLTVLDLGVGSAGTVNFFAGLDCPTRLIFADCETLSAELHAMQNQQEDDPPSFMQLVSHCRSHLAPLTNDETQTLDVILLWDHLHRFDAQGLEALSTVLQPHVGRGCRGYGFGSLHNGQKLPTNHYAIADSENIVLQPVTSNPLLYCHSQQTLSEYFICLQIARGTLLQQGHLELLFSG